MLRLAWIEFGLIHSLKIYQYLSIAIHGVYLVFSTLRWLLARARFRVRAPLTWWTEKVRTERWLSRWTCGCWTILGNALAAYCKTLHGTACQQLHKRAGTWLSVLNHFPSSDPASLDQVSHWKPDPPASFSFFFFFASLPLRSQLVAMPLVLAASCS